MQTLSTQDIRAFAERRLAQMRARADLYLARAEAAGNDPKATVLAGMLLEMIDEAGGVKLLADLAGQHADVDTCVHITTQVGALATQLLAHADRAHAACSPPRGLHTALPHLSACGARHLRLIATGSAA
jgi:hypothetical protein